MIAAHLRFSVLTLLLVGVVSCKERDAGKASLMSDPQVSDVGVEHPCAIATTQNSFDADPVKPFEDKSNLLNRRDWSMVRSLAMVSRLTYEDTAKIQATGRLWGYRTTDVIVEGPNLAIVASNEKCAVVAFRGTDFKSLRDWFTDANAIRRAGRDGSLHRGFYLAYGSMEGRLRRVLQAHAADEKVLWVTGHSLGGALAGVFAYANEIESPRRGIGIANIVTFGQPLFTDTTLADVMRRKFYQRYLRVVNDSDVVTRVPPWFSHFGSLLWLKPSGSEFHPEVKLVGSITIQSTDADKIRAAEIPPELAPTKEAFDEFKGESDPIRPYSTNSVGSIKSVDDHMMTLYLDRITQKWQQISENRVL